VLLSSTVELNSILCYINGLHFKSITCWTQELIKIPNVPCSSIVELLSKLLYCICVFCFNTFLLLLNWRAHALTKWALQFNNKLECRAVGLGSKSFWKHALHSNFRWLDYRAVGLQHVGVWSIVEDSSWTAECTPLLQYMQTIRRTRRVWGRILSVLGEYAKWNWHTWQVRWAKFSVFTENA